MNMATGTFLKSAWRITKTMSKLQELTKCLKSHLIILIDDDFTVENDLQNIVGGFCMASKNAQKQLLRDLEKIEETEITESLASFFHEFQPLLRYEALLEDLPPQMNLNRFLEMGEMPSLINHRLFGQLDRIKTDKRFHAIQSIFLRYGILSFIPDHYQPLIDELKELEECVILYFKSEPSEYEKDAFFVDVQSIAEDLKSLFCLFIVDKALPSSNGSEAGRIFLEDLHKSYKDQFKLRFACCLFTSRPGSQTDHNYYGDFVIQEVDKSNENVTDVLANVLAHSAYAEVFDQIRKRKKNSADHALKVVLKNQKNIKYIINEGHKEGVPAYESLKYWFDLASQRKFEEEEAKEFKFLAGLSSLFNEGYLPDHEAFHEIGEELAKLNTHELYDYQVNSRHLPIAPGDIWESNGEYYILVGQLCDLVLRKEDKKPISARKAKIGELISISISDTKPTKKYDIEFKNNKKIIKVDYFLLPNDAESSSESKNLRSATSSTKALEIDVSTPYIHFADLEVLDLAMFNEKGKCEIKLKYSAVEKNPAFEEGPNTVEELSSINEEPIGEEERTGEEKPIGTEGSIDEEIKRILPEGMDDYFIALQGKYLHFYLNNPGSIRTYLEQVSPMKFARYKFELSENDFLSHNVRRVCRLRGRYFDSLYNNYLNSKGRIDLYLTDNSKEITTSTKLVYQLAFDESTRKESTISIYKSREKDVIRWSDLQNAIEKPYNLLVRHADEDIDLKKRKEFEEKYKLKVIADENSVKIHLPYLNQKGTALKIDLYEHEYRGLFIDPKRYENEEYSILGGDATKRSFKNSKVKIEDLKAGIVIEKFNEKAIFVDGILKILPLDE